LPVGDVEEPVNEDESGVSQIIPPSPSLPQLQSHSEHSTSICVRFKQVLLPSSANRHHPASTKRRSSKSTQTFRLPLSKPKQKRRSVFTWRHSSVLLVPLSSLSPSTVTTQTPTTPTTPTSTTGEQRSVRRLRRDKRAATSLLILVLVFMIFLLPYVVVVVVGRIFTLEILTDTNGQLYSAAFWLLWLNSTVNPILYPFIQPRFRDAYKKLYFRLIRRRRRLASLIADMQRNAK
jgi:hypothetical protein